MSKKEAANNDWFYKVHWMMLIPLFIMYIEVRESIPRQVDKKSGAPEEGARGPRLLRRRKGQTFFSTLLCLS